jgi:hypothetical protein
MALEHFLNAEFDLSLRPGWRPPANGAARQAISDLSWHALFLADRGESVLQTELLPDDFGEYIVRSGIDLPPLSVIPGLHPGSSLSPFGWNARAEELDRSYPVAAEHPALDVVARVNGRRFSAHLERELFGDDHTLAVATGELELLDALARLPKQSSGLLLKADHGNAALGNRRLSTRTLADGDLNMIRRTFAEDEAMVVEPWLKRLVDLCATFSVLGDGSVIDYRLNEIVNTADGALIGTLFDSDDAVLAEWGTAMAEASSAIAGRLAGEGYRGPTCVDAFVWDDNGVPRLRRLVDLNARRQMSAGALRLWQRLGGRGAAYWRFYSRRKLLLPASYDELERHLGEAAWDPARRRGVLITAPLWLGRDRRSPAKIAALLVGRNRNEVLAMDRRVRSRLERR